MVPGISRDWHYFDRDAIPFHLAQNHADSRCANVVFSTGGNVKHQELGPRFLALHRKWREARIVRQTSQPAQEHFAPEAPESVGAAGLDASDVWKAVDRIRRSRAMSGCQRLSQLLTFVVDTTLRGEADHLKETTIGVSVFGRNPDYDPKVDTIVRSQAWRLRAKLKKYYMSEGLHDPVVIEVPKGHYVPVFHVRDEVGV